MRWRARDHAVLSMDAVAVCERRSAMPWPILRGMVAACLLLSPWAAAQSPPVACGITSHTGASGSSFAFGPAGVNASATLQNITFDAGSTAGGSVNRFVDSTGRSYTTPAGPGRWLLTNSNTTTRLTVTFSPAIPAHRIGLAIYDIGTWDAVSYTHLTLPTKA